MRQLSELVVREDGFAFDPSFGESFLLNKTAVAAIEALRSGDIQSAAHQLAKRYGIAENEALSDLFQFVAKLRLLGFEVL